MTVELPPVDREDAANPPRRHNVDTSDVPSVLATAARKTIANPYEVELARPA